MPGKTQGHASGGRRRVAGPHIVAVVGKIDASTVSDLQNRLDAVPVDAVTVVVDLGQVSVLQPAGAQTLVAAGLRARRRGGRLVVSGAGPGMVSVLRAAGFGRFVPLDLVPS